MNKGRKNSMNICSTLSIVWMVSLLSADKNAVIVTFEEVQTAGITRLQ